MPIAPNMPPMMSLTDAPGLANDPALATNEQRVHARPMLLARLGEMLVRHRADELAAKLEAAGLPYAPIVRPDQLLDDPHLRASGGLSTMQTEEGPTDVVPLPLTLDGRRLGVRMPLARTGEHNDEVLGARPKRTDP